MSGAIDRGVSSVTFFEVVGTRERFVIDLGRPLSLLSMRLHYADESSQQLPKRLSISLAF